MIQTWLFPKNTPFVYQRLQSFTLPHTLYRFNCPPATLRPRCDTAGLQPFSLSAISDFSPLISQEMIMSSVATADLCDAHASHLAVGDLRVLDPVFNIYGHCRAFSGPVVTLKVFETNVLVQEYLEKKGDGRVLVIDGGGSMKCPLMGGDLCKLGLNNGWAGIIINGCIRDVDQINNCDIGVRALGSHPKKPYKKAVGESNVSVHIGGTIIHDGEWLYADSDGILVSKTELSL